MSHKLLFDQNLSFRLVAEVEAVFPGSAQVIRLGLDAADDLAIWRYAGANGFALFSKDQDFANRVALKGPPPKVVWLRIGNSTWREVLAMIRKHEAAILRFLDDPESVCLELH